MPVDFNQIAHAKPVKRLIDPIDLFQSLRITDGAINDLWLAQGEALREWHTYRTLADTAILLNTGAGKTLVGLLAAQSLVNETQGHVVYACGSIQLVKQTAAMATGYGIDITTYYEGDLSNDLYQRGLAPCITTYQALFNGKSRFFRDDLAALVFDDAHTANHLLRDHFTLHLTRETFPQLFSQVVQLFAPYHTRIGESVSYREIYQQGDASTVRFVPPFAVHAQLGELQRLLVEADLSAAVETLFAWEHLRDHLEACALLITGKEMALTPPVVPIHTLPYFQKGIRRLYLSATLAVGDGFLRTFGRLPSRIIAPKTTAGECERLILLPALHRACTDDVAMAKRLLHDRKALLLVPSYRRAGTWADVAPVARGDIAALFDAFKRADPPAKLLLVGRYDGLDLPGDTCRLLLIDELPASVGLLERYLWERLGQVKSLRSTVASRVVQSFGRISRGMSDYGVVVLTGKHLIHWLLDPQNRATLPTFLQQQLEMGVRIAKQVETLADLEDAVQQCLARDPGWVNFYQGFDMEDLLPSVDTGLTDREALAIAQVEVTFGQALWERDYAKAAKALDTALDVTFAASTNTGAWHALWLGYCYELLGDGAAATIQYHRAHSAARMIPPYDDRTPAPADSALSPQVREVVGYLHGDRQLQQQVLQHMDVALAVLDGSGTPGATEEALRALGEYLGLVASRPDNEYGTGPDVLWETPGEPALSLEVKSGKIAGTDYRKRDVGQVYNHLQWVRDHTAAPVIYSAFVGRVTAATADSSPSADMMVIELAAFQDLAARLRAALIDIYAQAVLTTLPAIVQEVFAQRHLLWPDLYTQLPKWVLRDI